MRRYLGTFIFLAACLVVGNLGASTSSTEAPPAAAPELVMPWTPSFLVDAASDSCSLALINENHDDMLRQAGSCVPYGNLCDPRYVPGAVCCPGLHCTYLYPGVPRYCL